MIGPMRPACRYVIQGISDAVEFYDSIIEGTLMILDPSTFECPEHHIDLTHLVADELEDEGLPVAYFRRQGPRPFEVLVTCPGTGGASAHDLKCSGTRTR